MQLFNAAVLANTKINQDIRESSNTRGKAMKKGDLLQNIATGEMAIVIREPFVKFFPDQHHCDAFDSGVASTAIRIKWIEGGYERTLKKKNLLRFWEVLSESR